MVRKALQQLVLVIWRQAGQVVSESWPDLFRRHPLLGLYREFLGQRNALNNPFFLVPEQFGRSRGGQAIIFQKGTSNQSFVERV